MKEKIKYVAIVILAAVLISIVICRCGADTAEMPPEPVESPVAPSEDLVVYPIEDNIALSERIDTLKKALLEENAVQIEIPHISEIARPKLYTDRDAIALAKLARGEAGGVGELVTKDGRVVSPEAQQAAVMWSVLNRYDAGPEKYYAREDSIYGVITAPGQFHGYDKSFEVRPELLELAYDVLERWNNEQYGVTDVGRVLPKEYMFFHGDGRYNYFRDKYDGDFTRWDWSLEDPYAEN